MICVYPFFLNTTSKIGVGHTFLKHLNIYADFYYQVFQLKYIYSYI